MTANQFSVGQRVKMLTGVLGKCNQGDNIVIRDIKPFVGWVKPFVVGHESCEETWRVDDYEIEPIPGDPAK